MLTLAHWELVSRTLLNSRKKGERRRGKKMMKRKRKYSQLAHFLELPGLQGNRRYCRTTGQGQTSLFQKALNVTLFLKALPKLVPSPGRLKKKKSRVDGFSFRLIEEKCFRTSS